MLPASRAGNLYFYPRGLMSILTKSNEATNSNNSQQSNTTPEELREAAKYRLQLEKSHLVDHLATFYPKKAVLVGDCGTSRHYERYEYIATHEPLRLLSWANFCHMYKFCPVCSRIYSLQNAADLHGRIRHIQRERKAANLSPYRYLFLTLTVKTARLGSFARRCARCREAGRDSSIPNVLRLLCLAAGFGLLSTLAMKRSLARLTRIIMRF